MPSDPNTHYFTISAKKMKEHKKCFNMVVCKCFLTNDIKRGTCWPTEQYTLLQDSIGCNDENSECKYRNVWYS